MLVVKVLMRAMSMPSVPWVDLAAYTGYAYVQGCVLLALGYLAGAQARSAPPALPVQLRAGCGCAPAPGWRPCMRMGRELSIASAAAPAGSKGFYGVWLYSSVCNATFMVRTMKRIIFQESKQYGERGGAPLGLRLRRALAGRCGRRPAEPPRDSALRPDARPLACACRAAQATT